MNHPRTRAERRIAKKKEFNRKYFLSQNASYPAPYSLTYARNKGRYWTLRTKPPVGYDFKVPGEYKDYHSWRGKYRVEKFIFVSLVMLVVIVILREKRIKPCAGMRIFRLERVMIIVEFMNMLGWWING